MKGPAGQRAGLLGLHRTVTMGKTVLGRLPPLGHCTDRGLKHTPNLLVKKAHLSVLELSPQGQAL